MIQTPGVSLVAIGVDIGDQLLKSPAISTFWASSNLAANTNLIANLFHAVESFDFLLGGLFDLIPDRRDHWMRVRPAPRERRPGNWSEPAIHWLLGQIQSHLAGAADRGRQCAPVRTG